MAVFWMTEAIPLPATALLPMILFPMLGLRGAKDVAVNYLKVGVTQGVTGGVTLGQGVTASERGLRGYT